MQSAETIVRIGICAKCLHPLRDREKARGDSVCEECSWVMEWEKRYPRAALFMYDAICGPWGEDEIRRHYAVVSRDIRLQQVEREAVIANPLAFLSTYCWTIDEHPPPGVHPVRKFPHPKDKLYLYVLALIWLSFDKVAIPKSRQIMVSWLLLALHYWLAATQPHARVAVQSKKSRDANKHLDRIKAIHDNLPPWIQLGRIKKRTKDAGEIRFLYNGSEITGVPEGEDQLRQYTCTAVFSDEVAAQEYAEEAYTAAKPTVDNGGKWTAVSNPKNETRSGQFWRDLCLDNWGIDTVDYSG